MKLKKSQLKELIKQAIVQELKFGSKAQYDKYKKDHNIKPGTEIDIAGKKSKEKAPMKTSKAREKESDKFADAENAKLDAAEKAAKKKKKGKIKSNPFSESKIKRFTVKEVRMWMKKLEENRYKKVYNADARRVSWMANNEGVELSEMPKSMSKKWTKAQYGRERYLANEFVKSKSEQMTEGKLSEGKLQQAQREWKNLEAYLNPKQKKFIKKHLNSMKSKWKHFTSQDYADYIEGELDIKVPPQEFEGNKKAIAFGRLVLAYSGAIKEPKYYNEGKLTEGFKKIALKKVKYKDKEGGTYTWEIKSGIDTDALGGNTPKIMLFYRHEDKEGYPMSGGNTFWLKHKDGKPYTPQEAKALVSKISNKKIMDFQKKSQNPSGSGQNVYYVDGKFIREGKLTSEQKLRKVIREILKEQLNEAKMVSLNGQTKDYKKVVQLLKKMKLKSPKQYDLLPTGTNTFTINIDKKFYNKFLELAMNNKIDIRG